MDALVGLAGVMVLGFLALCVLMPEKGEALLDALIDRLGKDNNEGK